MTVSITEERQYSVDAKLIATGYQQIFSLDVIQFLQPPQGARVALIQAISKDVRWRDDGVSPTNTVGMVLAAGRDMMYVGDLNIIRFIEVAASAELNVSYYH